VLHKHEPIAEKEMSYASRNHSICQTLRDIYHKTNDPDIKLNCRIAVTMAKKMSVKLTENKKDWGAGFWDKQKLGEKIQISDKTKVQVTIG
jgi:hypothetical protein